MEYLGVNILNSDGFCTDLVSLFVNHLYDCNSCFDKFFGIIFILFIFIACLTGLISIVCCFFEKLFSKLFDRFRYKKLYDDLITKHGNLQEAFDELLDDLRLLESSHASLQDDYDKLEQDYLHTCN